MPPCCSVRSPSGDTPAATKPWPATCGHYAASRQARSRYCLHSRDGRRYGKSPVGSPASPGHLDPANEERLRAIRARCPELDTAVRHVAGFARMIKDLSGDRETLTIWMGTVDADLPVLRSFTAGLRRDLDAVVAGLTLAYNSGAVEGTVNRIKQLKAAMYGRAKPDLLRKLILLA